jgi:hypothetical protein
MARKNGRKTSRKNSKALAAQVAPSRGLPTHEGLDIARLRAALRRGGSLTIHLGPDFDSPELAVIHREDELERLVKVLEVLLPRACRIGRDSLKVTPRFTDRDREVQRLRDREHMSWKDVLHTIRRKPAWVNGQNGKPITLAALKAAHRRHTRRRS